MFASRKSVHLRWSLLLAAAVAALVAMLFPDSAAAGGYGHGHRHGYGHTGYGHRHFGHGHHRRHVHSGISLHFGSYRRRSRVHFAYHAPLYPEPYYYRPAPVVIHERPVVVYETHAAPSRALPDMPQLYFYPSEGQDEARTTQDRQECERWAWRQTRPDPTAGTTRTTRTVRLVPVYHRGYPDNPLPSAAGGAALGALGGAIAGDAGAGAAIGAAVGAASWFLGALAGPPRTRYAEEEVITTEYLPAPGPHPDDLRRALSACMEGRGYTVR